MGVLRFVASSDLVFNEAQDPNGSSTKTHMMITQPWIIASLQCKELAEFQRSLKMSLKISIDRLTNKGVNHRSPYTSTDQQRDS